MVYQDIRDDNSAKSSKPLSGPPLLDRFFSFLIDYMVLSPFISFAIFFLFKDAILYWRHNPDAPEQNLLLVIVALTVGFLFCLFQTFFIYFWKATPGQYYLKIQIQFEGSQTFIFWRALLRQLSFCASPLFLGLPWLALLGHSEGKAFYDRLADCHVISLKQNNEVFSFETEHKYWRSLLATLILFVSFLFGAVVWMQYEKVIQRVASFRQLNKNNYFCEDLKEVHISQRLQMAIAMNLINQLSDDCLDKEADFVLWKEKSEDKSLAYYAKSLTETDLDQENSYLTAACDGETELKFKERSFGCQIADSFAKQKFEPLYRALQSKSGVLATTFRYELGLTLHKETETLKNFQALQKFDSHRLIKKYLLSEMLNEKMPAERSPASVRSPASAQKIFDAEQAEKWMHEL